MSFDFAASIRTAAPASLREIGVTEVYAQVPETEALGVNVGSVGLSGVLVALGLPVECDGNVTIADFRERLSVAEHRGDPLVRQYLGDLTLLTECAWARSRDAYVTWG